MLPDHNQLVSFDRNEFATAFAWAMNAVSGAADRGWRWLSRSP